MTFEQFSADIWLILGLFMALTFVTSILFDRGISWLKRHGYDEGYVSLEVVAGVGYTLIFAGLFLWLAGYGWRPVAVTVAFFIASGLPMIIGDIARYALARKAETEDVS